MAPHRNRTAARRNPIPVTGLPHARWATAVLAALLVCATVAVYWPVRHHGFVEFDDPAYVTENPQVLAGLTVDGILWAFTTTHAANYHPLTWLSHMVDIQLFGLDAGAHHLVSVALHAASAGVLFVALLAMTGARGPSVTVAALFALHPLQVESVAWVAERKDVLSTLFWMLALLAYARYAERPDPVRYALVLALFVLGLLAKPMLVTLPFTLLLLDVWPLRRLRLEATLPPAWQALRPLLVEKLPFFVMSAASSVVTLLVQRTGGAMTDLEALPASVRISNAFVSYLVYLRQMIWPTDLAGVYPHAGIVPAWQAVSAIAVLVGVTLLAVRTLSQRPWFTVGWLWYLGTLVPVIGFVQVGLQARADRYTYVPLIGIFLVVAWAGADLRARWGAARLAVPALTLAALLGLGLASRAQLRHWATNDAFWARVVSLGLDMDEVSTHSVLASTLAAQGRVDEAIVHWQALVRLRPNDPDAYAALAPALAARGRLEEAVDAFRNLVRLRSEAPEAHRNLGSALADQGRLDEAIAAYRASLVLDPASADTHNELGAALGSTGRLEVAQLHFAEAVRLRPGFAEAHDNLGRLLAEQGRLPEARERFAEAARLKPAFHEARLNLAAVLAAEGRTIDALREIEGVLRAAPGHPRAIQMYNFLTGRTP